MYFRNEKGQLIIAVGHVEVEGDAGAVQVQGERLGVRVAADEWRHFDCPEHLREELADHGGDDVLIAMATTEEVAASHPELVTA